MVAYVLDGDIKRAMNNVENNIRKQHAVLRMEPPGLFRISAIRPQDSYVRETHHQRENEIRVFIIHHLFMSLEITESADMKKFTVKPKKNRKTSRPKGAARRPGTEQGKG